MPPDARVSHRPICSPENDSNHYDPDNEGDTAAMPSESRSLYWQMSSPDNESNHYDPDNERGTAAMPSESRSLYRQMSSPENESNHYDPDNHGDTAAMPPGPRFSHRYISSPENESNHGDPDNEVDDKRTPLNPQLRTENPSQQPRPNTLIQPSAYMLWLVAGYSILALFSWIVTVFLVYHPVTTSHYDKSRQLITDRDTAHQTTSENTQTYSRNDQWYTAARVISAIVAILTIPVTSAVCSSAAVIYAQRCRDASKHLTVRQLMVLADKGWTNAKIYYVLLTTRDGWKIYGSLFLVLAMLLNTLGGTIQPLQQFFLSSEPVKTPTSQSKIHGLIDINDKFQDAVTSRGDTNAVVVSTRKALETTKLQQVQPQLWSGANIHCNKPNSHNHTGLSGGEVAKYCASGGLSLANMSNPALSPLFWAQLPSPYNTGLMKRQFLPRINSTAVFQRISATKFPTNCENITGSYHVRHSNTTIGNNYAKNFWSVEVCMLGRDYRRSPWKRTRDRQDFSEELYVQFKSGSNFYPPSLAQIYNVTGFQFHVILNTTAGFFELPNKHHVTGPLRNKDPLCDGQNPANYYGFCHAPAVRPRPSGTRNTTGQQYWNPLLKEYMTYTYPFYGHPEWVVNKGPLLTIAIALFGGGSLIDNLLGSPDLYNSRNRTEVPQCLDKVPLSGLMGNMVTGDSKLTWNRHHIQAVHKFLGGEDRCIPNMDISPASYGSFIIGLWLTNFRSKSAAFMSTVFTQAAFLANQAWMMDDGLITPTLDVSYDLGADSWKPNITRIGVIVISILLGMDIIGLFGMAFYSSMYPRWTNGLDALTMMQIGSTMKGKLPMTVLKDASKLEVLDQMDEWVGDMEGSE